RGPGAYDERFLADDDPVRGGMTPRSGALPRLPPAPRARLDLDQLDLKLALHVKRRGGFVVEAGANDGVTQSNTALLARYRGWRGLLVEPVSELAHRCRMLRPESVVEQAALVAPDHEQPTTAMRYANLMSLVHGARGSADADREHVAEGERLQGVSSYELEVPTRPLSAILDDHRVRRAELLCLDLEGYEPEALRGLDPERHPTFILVEVWDRAATDEQLQRLYEPLAELSRRDVLYRLRARARCARVSRSRDA
ncbi:MAG: FkbM family methyltransferase, partial [Chloroflexota bacterium]|nr:FkbM family methyltransferase [Chloroflexota bacterium]